MIQRRYSSNFVTYRGLSQTGMSLVELMIAMVLSLIVVAALSQLFVNMSRSTQEMAKSGSQIENARFGMQYLQDDIVHAGFWGGYLPNYDDLSASTTVAPADEPTIVMDPCKSFASWTAADRNAVLGIPVDVRADIPALCLASIDFGDPDDATDPHKVGNTDVLIVRHANTCVPGDANCEALVNGDLYLQVSNCEAELTPLGNALVLAEMDATASAFTRTKRDCGDPTVPADREVMRKFIQTLYYVRDWTNEVGDGTPALVRSSLRFYNGSLQHEPFEVMVEGIERLRVEVGIDDSSKSGVDLNAVPAAYNQPVIWEDEGNLVNPTNRGDGIPDGNFVHCAGGCTAVQLRDLVAVKLYILSRANEATAGYVDTKDYTLGGSTISAATLADDFKRHVFSQTVRINNVSSRRETPTPLPVVP